VCPPPNVSQIIGLISTVIYAGFEVLTAVLMKGLFLLGYNAVYSVESHPTFLEGHVASIFRVQD
jgi:hypothetical protein